MGFGNLVILSGLLALTFKTGAVTVPAECEGQRFCNRQLDDYPTKLIDEIDLHHLNGGTNVTQYYKEIQDEENCGIIMQASKPFALQENGKWHYIVQSNFFNQVVVKTECLNPGRKCFEMLAEDTYLNMTCSNVYTSVKIYVYNVDVEPKQLEVKEVPIPVYCNCALK